MNFKTKPVYATMQYLYSGCQHSGISERYFHLFFLCESWNDWGLLFQKLILIYFCESNRLMTNPRFWLIIKVSFCWYNYFHMPEPIKTSTNFVRTSNKFSKCQVTVFFTFLCPSFFILPICNFFRLSWKILNYIEQNAFIDFFFSLLHPSSYSTFLWSCKTRLKFFILTPVRMSGFIFCFCMKIAFGFEKFAAYSLVVYNPLWKGESIMRVCASISACWCYRVNCRRCRLKIRLKIRSTSKCNKK